MGLFFIMPLYDRKRVLSGARRNEEELARTNKPVPTQNPNREPAGGARDVPGLTGVI